MQRLLDGQRWLGRPNFDKAEHSRGETTQPAWALPSDLRQWTDSATLILWIKDAVAQLDWEHPLVARYLEQNPDPHPRTMLELLGYAYVTRISGSEGILASCQVEPELRGLCDGHPPFREEIISFRRGNRKVLERVLADLYRRAVQSRLPGTRDSIALNDFVREAAADRLNSVRHMDAAD